ncbi:MAG: hypothetical protein V4723_07325 [Pseudomonadota bacterium]
MAADYFFTEKQRDVINAMIKARAKLTKKRIVADFDDHVHFIVANGAALASAAALLLLGWVITVFLRTGVAGPHGGWVVSILALLALLAVAVSIPRLLTVLVDRVAPIMLGSSVGLVLMFVSRCPKGSVFGVGFLFLIASFLCRWRNLYQGGNF